MCRKLCSLQYFLFIVLFTVFFIALKADQSKTIGIQYDVLTRNTKQFWNFSACVPHFKTKHHLLLRFCKCSCTWHFTCEKNNVTSFNVLRFLGPKTGVDLSWRLKGYHSSHVVTFTHSVRGEIETTCSLLFPGFLRLRSLKLCQRCPRQNTTQNANWMLER